jgi:hypothetical protein
VPEHRRSGDVECTFDVVDVAVAQPDALGPHDDLVIERIVENDFGDLKARTPPEEDGRSDGSGHEVLRFSGGRVDDAELGSATWRAERDFASG